MASRKPALLPEAEQDAWLDGQAEQVIRIKSAGNQELQAAKEALRRAYCNIYRAVALDVDGTLTTFGGVGIAKEMADIVARLLLRGVPLLLISGRGRGSMRAAAEEIMALSNLHPSYLRLLRCVTHNGLFYLSTPNEFPARPLSKEVAIAEPLVNIETLQADLALRFREDQVRALVTVEPSGPNPYALRVVVPRDADIDSIRENLEAAAVSNSVGPHRITTGAYGTNVSIDVSSTHKGLALSHFATEIGIDTSEILCIGDKGDEQGNDYDLLKYNSGFSVGTCASFIEGCHPVISDDGQVLTGEEATRALLDRILLFPAISVFAEPIENRLESLRNFERVALQRAREETALTLSRVQNRLRYLLDPQSREGVLPTLTLDDLLDQQSGAIRLRDYEIPDIWEFHQVSELFGLEDLRSTLTKAPRGQWWMYTDSSVLLRGPMYYYSMTSHDPSLISYIPHCLRFVEGGKEVLDLYQPRRVTLASLKVVLGILDNVRNFLLTSLYAAFEVEGRSSGGEHPTFNRTEELHALLVGHSGFFIQLLIGPAAPWRELVGEISSHLVRVAELFRTLASSDEPLDRAICRQGLRKWRECDNFLENYTAVQLGLSEFAEQYGKRPQGMCVLGLLYGGIELPSIAKAIAVRQNWILTAGLCKVSIYHDRSAGAAVRAGGYDALRRKLAETEPIFMDGPQVELRDQPMIIADDNTTTGVTLQLARDYFVARGADVRGALVVRFPGANRHVQMAIPGHGFPNPEMLFSFIRGLVSPSPYSRLLFPNRDSKDPYLDNLGVFCRARNRIARYLIKNGTPPVQTRGIANETGIRGALHRGLRKLGIRSDTNR